MHDSWTFTEAWGSWQAGQALYPNAHLTDEVFRSLLASGVLIRSADYKPKPQPETKKVSTAPPPAPVTRPVAKKPDLTTASAGVPAKKEK